MIKIERNGSSFEVIQNGQVVFTGTMAEAMKAHAELVKAELNAKPARRSGGRKIFA